MIGERHRVRALEDAGVIRKRSEHCKPRRNRVPGRVNVFETT